ncbi:hypothetical protein THIOKS12130002 [Thiocapsa sp. KS1]|nr:hypothetical protein THIOKS12130002 [Thiocapsa sp. KS1]
MRIHTSRHPEDHPGHRRHKTMTAFTAYFDGGCPLCSKEIAHYRRIDKAGAIHWVDLRMTAAHWPRPGSTARTPCAASTPKRPTAAS